MALGKNKSTSIVDVAKKAGVAPATVSRVLNDSSLVTPETAKRVLEVATQLGYSLSPRRPGPKPGQTSRKKKVIFINFLDQYHLGEEPGATFLSLQRGLEAGGKENGFSIHFHFLSTEADLSDVFLKEKYSGFILQGSRPHPSAETFLKKHPCCWITNNPWTPTWGDHVMPDHREVGMMAADYLITHGCHRPVMVTLGRPDRVSVLREEGFKYAAKKKGLKAPSLMAGHRSPENPVNYPEAMHVDRIVDKFKKVAPSADGIFFDSDRSLVTLYSPMVREKLIVPGKTILIGCNNQQLYLKGIDPHPATLEVHFEQIGRQGVAQLAWRIRSNNTGQRVRSLISPTLISLR